MTVWPTFPMQRFTAL